MTSLRERLESKSLSPRRVVVQIPVGDPPEDLRRRVAEEVDRAVTAEFSVSLPDSAITAELAETVVSTARASVDELAEFYAPVELQALGAVEWDDLQTKHTTTGDDLDDAWLPAVLAVSCTDPDLRDETWWAGQLMGAGWSVGEVLAVRSAVMRLNAYVPLPALGKGSRTTR